MNNASSNAVESLNPINPHTFQSIWSTSAVRLPYSYATLLPGKGARLTISALSIPHTLPSYRQ